jgi:hypothetical protein
MRAANDLAVRRALEMAGIGFIDENGGGPGVDCAVANAKNSPNRGVRISRSALRFAPNVHPRVGRRWRRGPVRRVA